MRKNLTVATNIIISCIDSARRTLREESERQKKNFKFMRMRIKKERNRKKKAKEIAAMRIKIGKKGEVN
jgi:hypothetical protein